MALKKGMSVALVAFFGRGADAMNLHFI